MAGQPIDDVPDVVDSRALGHGGFGDVYVGREVTLDREVAIKILRVRPDQSTRRSFDREVAALARLGTHPNIVTLHRADITTSGYPYLVMEYAAGGSLAAKLAETGPLPWNEAVDIVRDAATGLAEAHRQGIRHRDIKPGNIFISTHGVPLLGDFGIATISDQTITTGASVTASMGHASPEQISGGTIDDRTDIYSLASTLYELITGTPAFIREGDDLVATIARISTQPPEPLPATIPASIRNTIAAAMAKDPDLRPATAEQFRDMLVATGPPDHTIVVPTTPPATPGTATATHTATLAAAPTDTSPPGGRVGLILTAAGLILAGLIGYVIFTRGSTPTAEPTTPSEPAVTEPVVETPTTDTVVDDQSGTVSSPTAVPEGSEPASTAPTTDAGDAAVVPVTEPPPPSREAMVSVSADDGYETYLNGQLISASWMSAETYELPVVAGQNVIGVRVGAFPGSVRGIAAKLQLDPVADPTGRFIEPSEWLALAQADPGPGWSAAGFDAAGLGWRPAATTSSAPSVETVTGLEGLDDANWAWFDDDADAGHVRFVFDAPQEGIARFTVTASAAYSLQFNGGQLPLDGWFSRDTASADVIVGTNVVGVRVLNLLGPAGALATVSVDGEQVASTDSTWRISTGPADDLAWSTTEFSDAELLGATEYGAPGEPDSIWGDFTLWPEQSDVQWIWLSEGNRDGLEEVIRDRDERFIRREFVVTAG